MANYEEAFGEPRAIGFKVEGKHLALTYSARRVGNEINGLRQPILEREEILQHMQRYVGGGRDIKHYLIAKETHEDGEFHYHAYFGWTKPLRVSNASVALAVKLVNPNIGRNPSSDRFKRYMLVAPEDGKTIDETPLTNYTEEELEAFRKPAKRSKNAMAAEAMMMAKAGDPKGAAELIKAEAPWDWLKSGKHFKAMLDSEAPPDKMPLLTYEPRRSKTLSKRIFLFSD